MLESISTTTLLVMLYVAFHLFVTTRLHAKAWPKMEAALEKLILHDFGALTLPIINLHKRLTMRMGKILPWTHFTAETGSNLIARYCDMFVQSVLIGASPKDVALMISQNV